MREMELSNGLQVLDTERFISQEQTCCGSKTCEIYSDKLRLTEFSKCQTETLSAFYSNGLHVANLFSRSSAS